MDNRSYKYAFISLNDNYNFNQKLIHIDFEDALANFLLIKNYIKNHFINQMNVCFIFLNI